MCMDVYDMTTIEDLSKFTYNSYINLLKELNEKYELIPCSEVPKMKTPFIALQHDIDGSLESALEMAKVENKIGVQATYFVLFSHKLYNLLEVDNLNLLKKISALNHEIGIHYDPEAFKEYEIPPYMLLDQQIDLLSSLLGTSVKSIARHKNSIKNIVDPFAGRPYIEKGRNLIFNSGLTQHFKLIVKDSCREWKELYVKKLLSYDYNRVKICTHPLYWNENEMNREECMRKLFDRTHQNNEEYHDLWLKTWEKLGR